MAQRGTGGVTTREHGVANALMLGSGDIRGVQKVMADPNTTAITPHSGGTIAAFVSRLRTEGRAYTHRGAALLIEQLAARVEELEAGHAAPIDAIYRALMEDQTGTLQRRSVAVGSLNVNRSSIVLRVEDLLAEVQKVMADPNTTNCRHCRDTRSLPIPEGNLLRDRHGWTALACPWCDHEELYCAEETADV